MTYECLDFSGPMQIHQEQVIGRLSFLLFQKAYLIRGPVILKLCGQAPLAAIKISRGSFHQISLAGRDTLKTRINNHYTGHGNEKKKFEKHYLRCSITGSLKGHLTKPLTKASEISWRRVSQLIITAADDGMTI